MSEKGLQLKYFVLEPEKDNDYGVASRQAMSVFASVIHMENPELADDLEKWIKRINKKIESPKFVEPLKPVKTWIQEILGDKVVYYPDKGWCIDNGNKTVSVIVADYDENSQLALPVGREYCKLWHERFPDRDAIYFYISMWSDDSGSVVITDGEKETRVKWGDTGDIYQSLPAAICACILAHEAANQ